MSSPHIDAVRQSLMATLEDLRNKEKPMDIDRARAIAEVATVLVNSARVENEYLKITGQDKSNFLETPPDYPPAIAHSDSPSAHNPFPNVVRHRLA